MKHRARSGAAATRCFVCVSVFALLVNAQIGAATGTSVSGSAATSGAPLVHSGAAQAGASLLLERSAFIACERDAFTALTAARNAMYFGDSAQTQLVAPTTTGAIAAMLRTLYAEIERTGSRDHGAFAADRFIACARTAKLPINRPASATAQCLLQLDVAWFAYARRLEGKPEAETLRLLRPQFAKADARIYGRALIERVVPMVYRIRNDEDEYALRQVLFESCLLPEDWRARRAAHRTAVPPASPREPPSAQPATRPNPQSNTRTQEPP